MKNNKAITLVALIITVIILLILAGVVISMTVGDKGIINKSMQAVEKYENAVEREEKLLGDVSNYIGGNYKDTIEEPKEPPKEPLPEIDETEAFSRAIGVIDIVWLNTDNTVIEKPISPASYLGGLTAIKYDGTNWVNADTANTNNDWYNYVAQTGTTDGKTSNWANARTSDSNAYFVWIPRYAYKITYFDNQTHANAYKTSGSKEGIIGYSNIEGLVDVASGTEKLVTGSEPINVTGTVKTKGYTDYIPHPAFEFDGAKAGIWVGKFESSGSTAAVTIKPNTPNLRDVTVSQIFTACQGVKKTYTLQGDSHMLKNTEWGAVAYLTESKYGRNGTEICQNTNSSYKTGGGNYTANVLQSTTGNIYGIYDMSGGAWEYVAGYVNNSNVSSNRYNANLLNAVAQNKKYADVYKVTTDDSNSNYANAKGMKGDAVYETSTASTGSTSWHADYSHFPYTCYPVFVRGAYFPAYSGEGVFAYSYIEGGGGSSISFRVALVP